jgi:hypothetical protein
MLGEESLQEPISTNKKLGVVAYTCHSSYLGSINRRIIVQAKHMRPYLRNKKDRKAREHGSSGRVPARQA